KKFRDAVTANPSLKHRPELDALRKALLKEPLVFFGNLRDQLQADRDTRPDALAKLAGASFNLAETTEEIGSIPDAIRAHAEALDLRDRLVRDHPTIARYQRDLAESHHHIGYLLSLTGESAQALHSYREAIALRERLAGDHPTGPQYHRDLAQ